MIADLDDHLRSRTCGDGRTRPRRPPRPTAGQKSDDGDRSPPSGRRSGSGGAAPGGWCWRWSSSSAVATLTTYLTAPRPGGRMDPASTSPEGAHALVTLLRDHGVDVDRRRRHRRRRTRGAARHADRRRRRRSTSSTTTCCAGWPRFPATGCSSSRCRGPGKRLRRRSASRGTAPSAAPAGLRPAGGDPRRARCSSVSSDAYEAAGDVPVTRCYDGALVRYSDDGPRR